MKRKKLSYDEWKWKSITSRDFKVKKLDLPKGTVHLVFNAIKEVSEPQCWSFNGKDIVVCDRGITWLAILPQSEKYCITAMLDENGDVILWYIDMIASQGVDEDGIPYFDDLYLDLVVYPDGTVYVDDRDELEEAYQSGDISRELYELALETCDNLKNGLLSSVEDLKDLTGRYYDLNIVEEKSEYVRAFIENRIEFLKK